MGRLGRGSFIPLMLFTWLFLSAGATVAAEPTSSWGVYLGLNLANMTGDIDQFNQSIAEFMGDEFGNEWTVTNGARTGMLGGAYYQRPLSRTFGLQIEGLLVKRGMKQEFDTGNFSADVSWGLNYLEIPLLLK